MIDPHLLSRLRCPDCCTANMAQEGAELLCPHCGAHFPLVAQRLVLLRHDHPLFPIDAYRTTFSPPAALPRSLDRFIPSPSVNLASTRVLGHLRQLLDEHGGPADILVVGGGRQRMWLNPLLRAIQPHRVVYSDIDVGADVDLFCDGHDLPFTDSSFDAVITTAVLEHVLYPERVAAEITRVLKSGGLLYSELPFMQQVHEGAYDFTRYTLSGHRRLFNRFAEIDAGLVAGPATALVWALENLALAFVSHEVTRKLTKAGVRLMFSWIKYLDRCLAHRPEAMDGASCTYFLGSKIEGQISDAEIVARYVGAKSLQHV